MPEITYETLLTSLGLTGGEALIYQVLLERESGNPAELAVATHLKRPDIYNKLAALKQKGLIEEFTAPNGKKRFRLEHPQKLGQLIEQREKEIKTIEKQLSVVLPQLTSKYQLTSNKPGISYFEGKDGARHVLEATLSAKTIDQFLDGDAVLKYIPDLNAEFSKKRDKLGIKKRIILIDGPLIRGYLAKQHRETIDYRFANFSYVPFNTSMSIFDDKVSFLTLKPKAMIGIIIQDPIIANMQRGIFESIWTSLSTANSLNLDMLKN